MSNFQGFYVDGSIDPKVQANAMACAIASTEECIFPMESNVGTLIELAMFLKLAIDKEICEDTQLVETISGLYQAIISSIKSNYPCFEKFDFSSYEKWQQSKNMAKEVTINPIIVQMSDGIVQQIQEQFDALAEEQD